jgi:hypothetical protein
MTSTNLDAMEAVARDHSRSDVAMYGVEMPRFTSATVLALIARIRELEGQVNGSSQDHVLDAASDYMKAQYGIGALFHPVDRQRILSALAARPHD